MSTDALTPSDRNPDVTRATVQGPSRVCSRVVRAAAGKQNVHVKAAQEQQKDAKPTAADKGFGHAEKKEHSPQQHRVHESSGTGHRFLAWLQVREPCLTCPRSWRADQPLGKPQFRHNILSATLLVPALARLLAVPAPGMLPWHPNACRRTVLLSSS